ncbi:MAG TPA: ABC transporter substrate-binding protein [Mesorhizobium sp.]|jgi:putative spermidine/putrescine transport system substrate-binding protein|nr:ABC transporter substrate-binding protein [Mesorhizobium sp.]
MHRRSFLLSASAGAIAGLGALPRLAFGQNRPFTFTSWGGALSDAEKAAFTDPFAELKGIEIINTSPTETAKIKAMAEAGSVEWDLVDVGGRTVWQGAAEGFLEELDLAKIPNAASLDERWVAPHGIATSSGATIMAWSTTAFPEGGPESWADFWDVKRFPGPRGLYKYFYYNYEASLLAAGVKREEIYPLTPEKAEMALSKIAEIKPNVSVWWGSGAQPPQLLSSGELALSSVWSGRALAAGQEGAPIGYTFKDGIAWSNWFVIPKGSPYVDLAHELINFSLAPEQQAKLLELKTYGPVLASVTEGADAETMEVMVMAPKNLNDMLIISEKDAYQYMNQYEEKWNQLMLQ